MANHKSAEKRHRQNLVQNERNRMARSTTKTAIKKAITLAEGGEFDEARKVAQIATSLLDKGAIRGLYHQNNAKRRISRLYKRISTLSSATA